MADSVSFTVYGTPAPAGSKRFVGMRAGRGVIIESSKKAVPWKRMVAQQAGIMMEGRGLPLFRGALEASYVFYRKRPKSHLRADGTVKPSAPRYPSTKPDLTKLVRGTEDALRGVVWDDDAQVVTMHPDKRYGEPERCEIVIREML